MTTIERSDNSEKQQSIHQDGAAIVALRHEAYSNSNTHLDKAFTASRANEHATIELSFNTNSLYSKSAISHESSATHQRASITSSEQNDKSAEHRSKDAEQQEKPRHRQTLRQRSQEVAKVLNEVIHRWF